MLCVVCTLHSNALITLLSHYTPLYAPYTPLYSDNLRWFIRKKIKEDPIWRNLKVVFSGHDVPGEGEHKIMQFIRDLRAMPDYEPNVRHCMYGQDADLIMLGLATHEPHFALLREVVNFGGGFNKGGQKTVLRQTRDVCFQLLHLSILREYLALDFAFGIDWALDPERVVDDFILLTFLVGNDFLPHLPTLDISEMAFDTLISAYKGMYGHICTPMYAWVCMGMHALLYTYVHLYTPIYTPTTPYHPYHSYHTPTTPLPHPYHTPITPLPYTLPHHTTPYHAPPHHTHRCDAFEAR